MKSSLIIITFYCLNMNGIPHKKIGFHWGHNNNFSNFKNTILGNWNINKYYNKITIIDDLSINIAGNSNTIMYNFKWEYLNLMIQMEFNIVV